MGIHRVPDSFVDPGFDEGVVLFDLEYGRPVLPEIGMNSGEEPDVEEPGYEEEESYGVREIHGEPVEPRGEYCCERENHHPDEVQPDKTGFEYGADFLTLFRGLGFFAVVCTDQKPDYEQGKKTQFPDIISHCTAVYDLWCGLSISTVTGKSPVS